MSTKANYFKIGLFVVSAVILAVAGILILARIRTQAPAYIESYINESVQGLSVGSAFKYRGVQLGRVDDITFVGSEYDVAAEYGRYVMVVISADAERLRGLAREGESVEQALDRMVGEGLRIQLILQPLTGVAYLEADYPASPNPALEPVDWTPAHHYVPSDMSMLASFAQSAERAFKTLGDIDIVKIARETERLLASLNEVVTDANIAELSTEAKDMFVEVRQTNKEVLALLRSKEGEGPAPIPEALARVNTTLVRVDRTLGNLDEFARHQQVDIEKAINNIREISANIRELTEDLKRYPGKVIFGKPPSKSEVMP